MPLENERRFVVPGVQALLTSSKQSLSRSARKDDLHLALKLIHSNIQGLVVLLRPQAHKWVNGYSLTFTL